MEPVKKSSLLTLLATLEPLDEDFPNKGLVATGQCRALVMSQCYLLDTDTLSDLVRHPQGAIADRIAREDENSVCTSIVVVCELRFGAAKKSSARLSSQLEIVLSGLEILPYEEPADRHYAKLRNHLEKAGTPIDPNDMLIAAHVLALGLTVVTGNVGESSLVPGLVVESWLET